MAKKSIKNTKATVVLKQKISMVGLVIVLLPILFFIFVFSVFNIFFVLLILICIPVLGFNFEYLIGRSFNNRVVFKIFNICFYTKSKSILYPDYISIVHQGYKDETGWSWFPSLFGHAKYRLYVVKFFNGNKRQTVFKTSNKEEAILTATKLSKLLNVKIHNTLKS